MKLHKIVAPVVLALAGLALASTDDNEIAAFFVPPERLERQFLALIPALERNYPEVASDLRHAAADFDGNALSARLGALLAASLSASDRTLARSFMNSASGKEFGRVQREAVDGKATEAALRKLPSATKQEIAAFVESPAGKRVLALIYSGEASTITQMYGSELRCRYVLKARPYDYERLRQDGRCPQLRASGA